MVFCAAGTRFRYPSSFVLVSGDCNADLARLHASLFQHQSSANADSGVSTTPATNAVDSALSKPASTIRLDCSVGDRQAARRAVGKIWQDGMLSSGLFMHGYADTASARCRRINVTVFFEKMYIIVCSVVVLSVKVKFAVLCWSV